MLKNICIALIASAFLVLSPATRAAEEETPLAKEMNAMDDNLKALKKIIANAAENKKSLELLDKVQASVVASKSMTPAEVKNIPEAERAQWVADYRKEMAVLLEHLCKMEVAIIDGKNADAETLFKGLKKIEDDGHEKFTAE